MKENDKVKGVAYQEKWVNSGLVLEHTVYLFATVLCIFLENKFSIFKSYSVKMFIRIQV